MPLWRHLPNWLLRAWPVLAVAPFAVFHYIALQEYLHSAPLVNKLMGMTLQVTGGMIILCSINETLGTFKSQSILGAVVGWFRAFPFKGRNITLSMSGVAMSTSFGNATLTVTKAATTVEERLEQLERAVVEVRQELRGGIAAVRTEVEAARTQLGGRIDATAGQISDLSQKVERVAIGGFKFQSFGVLLAVYGAVTSVFA